MPKNQAYLAAEHKIKEANRFWNRRDKFSLAGMELNELPPEIGNLQHIKSLDLSRNQLTTLPDSLGQLTQLQMLDLSYNQLTTLPESLGQLTQLQSLNLQSNQLTILPEWMVYFIQLKELNLGYNELAQLPEFIGLLTQLESLSLYVNRLATLPESLGNLINLKILSIAGVGLKSLPIRISELKKLEVLVLGKGDFASESWSLGNSLSELPKEVGHLKSLTTLLLGNNHLTDLPSSLAQLEHLEYLNLDNNPLNPALQSAYDQGLDAVKAYLRSLEQNAEPLYEAKLVLVGEGNVGKTTLLKALKGKAGEEAPRKDETKTHGVAIDIHGLRLPHPEKDGIEIQLNAWDFGGQEIYRVTHQFFFSRRSLYVLVWEPRRNVQQAQIEDWLNMIRLRVGVEARVLIVSTHCKSGETLARIDKPVLQEQYGNMIVGFYEVDSLVPDPATGEMTGIVELKKVIAEESAKLQHMGMPFNLDWKAARDELIASPEAHISYKTFTEVCARHNLSEIDTSTLAAIMNDLGYIVHYSDDEKLRDDVVLKPEWLTKAIGFVLEDRATAEREGILPDSELYKVWHDHTFLNEPRYTPKLYPFFLRLMEKYDVSYRLPDDRKASLVAQHVPQIRPDLPWLPEQEPPKDQRRIAMVCAMEEDPPGLVPWMIVRTHDYSVEQGNHHLHWQKGMFLSHGTHGQAMLEKRGREFHVYTQADWPEYFMNVLQHTLQKIITDNWPGMEGRYRFAVPCPEIIDGQPCKGRFNIHSLRQFLAEGDSTTRCPECTKKQSIVELLFGFEERTLDAKLTELQSQIAQVQNQIAGLDSRVADYFMATMRAIADEAKHAPRLFIFTGMDKKWSIDQIFSKPMKLQLWCEAEGCQHPVEKEEPGKGIYTIEQPQEWVAQIAPYANFALNVLKIVSPIAAPAINTFFGSNTTELWGIKDQLELADAVIDQLPDKLKPSDRNLSPGQLLSESERSGMLALHRLLEKLDPTQVNTGLHRVNTYTGDYRWLCKRHYDAYQPNIPDVISGQNSNS